MGPLAQGIRPIPITESSPADVGVFLGHTAMGGADWPQLLTDYVTELESRGYSRDTIRTRMSYLRRFAASNEPAAARQDLVAWLAHPTWAPATRKSARSSLRVFYAWMVEVGYLEHSPALSGDGLAAAASAAWQVAA